VLHEGRLLDFPSVDAAYEFYDAAMLQQPAAAATA
jgi:hypothetical protein